MRPLLDRLALVLGGFSFLWFAEPAFATGLQSGWFALLACLLLAISLSTTIRVRTTHLALGLVLLILLIDLVSHRLPYAGTSLPYLGCILIGLCLLLRTEALPLHFFAQVLAISASAAALFSLLCLLTGNPNVGGKIYLIINNGDLSGPMQQRNLFSSHLLLGLVALTYLYAAGLKKWLWIAGLFVMGCALALTQSRTGLLNIVILGALGAWLLFKKNKLGKPMLIACAALLVLQAALPLLFDLGTMTRMARDGALSSSELRVDASLRALKIFAAHPLTGVGIGNLTWHEHLIRLQEGTVYPVFVPQFDHSHNILTQMLAEAGILGGAAVLMLLAIYLFRLWKVADPDSAFALLGLTVLWVHSSLEYPLWYMHFFAIFLIFYLQIDTGKTLELRSAPLIRILIPGLVLLGSVHFLWNIWRLDDAIRLQSTDRNQAYALAQDVANFGGPATPYAHHLMLEMARPANSQETNQALTEIAGKLLLWRPDTFITYNYAQWLASIGQAEDAKRQLHAAYRVYPQKLAVFVRQLAKDYESLPSPSKALANEAFALCDDACRKEADLILR